MSKGFQILPECYGDTTLIEILEYKNPNHQPSITRVLSTLSDTKRANQTLVGVIDDDKKKPASYKEYNTQQETASLIRKKHPKRNHFLIVLKPALERFILTAANDANVDPAKFGFENETSLKRVCKSQKVGENQNFKQFINTIKQKKQDSDFKTLKTWLNEILGNNH